MFPQNYILICIDLSYARESSPFSSQTSTYDENILFFFTDIENNFGVSNEGVVYAVYAYQATRKDELSFECGECLTVVRRGDVNEKEWWWARDSRNQFGYIPRNLLGVSYVKDGSPAV